MNGQGLVPIRMTQTLQIGGSVFAPGQTHRVYWKLAVQLLAGVFAEIDRTPRPAEHRKGAKDVTAALKEIARRLPS